MACKPWPLASALCLQHTQRAWRCSVPVLPAGTIMITVSSSAAAACELAVAARVATSTFIRSGKLVYTIFAEDCTEDWHTA